MMKLKSRFQLNNGLTWENTNHLIKDLIIQIKQINSFHFFGEEKMYRTGVKDTSQFDCEDDGENQTTASRIEPVWKKGKTKTKYSAIYWSKSFACTNLQHWQNEKSSHYANTTERHASETGKNWVEYIFNQRDNRDGSVIFI